MRLVDLLVQWNRWIIPCSIRLGGMRVTFLKRRSWMNTTDFYWQNFASTLEVFGREYLAIELVRPPQLAASFHFLITKKRPQPGEGWGPSCRSKRRYFLGRPVPLIAPRQPVHQISSTCSRTGSPQGEDPSQAARRCSGERGRKGLSDPR